MWTPERLNRSENLYGFKFNCNGPEPFLVGWFEVDDWSVEVTIYPVDKDYCEVFVEGEDMDVAYTINEIESLCRQYCLDHIQDDFEGEEEDY